MSEPNFVHAGLAHFDISGTNCEALVHFYANVFGWAIERKGPGYAIAATPAGSPNGAIVESDKSGLNLGISVHDLSKTLELIEAQGGKITMPVTDNGWVKKAQFADTAGNELTLIEV